MADYKRMYNDLVDMIRREHELFDAERREHDEKYFQCVGKDEAGARFHDRMAVRYEGVVATTRYLLDYVQGQEVKCGVRVTLHLMSRVGCKLDLDVATREDLPRCVFVEKQHCVSGVYTTVRASVDEHMDFAHESAWFGVPMASVKFEDGKRYWWEDNKGRRVTEGVPKICVCHYRDTAFDFAQKA